MNVRLRDCSAAIPPIGCRHATRLHRITKTAGDEHVEEGLYEVYFYSVHGAGTGVVYAIGGKLRGGNAAFTFVGNYQNKGDVITVKVSTRRYNPDPDVKSLFGLEGVTLSLVGRVNGEQLDFEGNALQLPGVNFKARLTRVAD